ncbi:hypothetical protein K3H46_19525 [Aeromonas veronii]|uniref:hypothetical protein n=1 Tax=Aeromonas veronii TaxID=654 RepID=UPI001F383C3A|nr:hypothetical protein [Aeromonas veronii]MCF5893192.1 hypothetical protein [Aeromonas veronii]
MNSKVNVVFLFSLLSLNVSASERWAIDCVSGKGGIIIDQKNADIVVNSNQIVISTRVVRNGNKMSFFLKGPADLGRGGMMLNWDDFSIDKSIADAEMNGNNINLSWKGFFEKSAFKYVWVSESEFTPSHNKNHVTLMRCK